MAILRARKMLAEAAKAVAAGESPRGVVRDPGANNFNDIVVITKRLSEGVDSRAYCEELAGSELYALEPFTEAASRA
jgi:hypothetical protein